MPMLVLAGSFQVIHAAPDGDSIHFYPADPTEWDLVGGAHRVRRNAHGGAQLRLDAIDALETHYTPRGGQRLHQPLGLAHEAATRLLAFLGFSDVVRDPAETVTACTPDQVPGYLFTRTADKYGRCVALVGAGDPPAPSGTTLQVHVEQLEKTANYALLSEGLVYPTYYRLLYPDLRRALTKAVESARRAGAIWAQDVTTTGVTVTSEAVLTDEAVILPKLFRRLVDYLHLTPGRLSLAGFRAYLEQRDDRLWVISTGHSTGFGTVVAVEGRTVRMTEPPENLVFEEG